MAIEREIEDARSIRDTVSSGKRKEDQPSSVRERIRRLLSHGDFRDGAVAIRARTTMMFPLPSARTSEARLPSEARILGFWDNTFPIISRTGADTICSFSTQCRPEGSISVPRCCTTAFCYTDWPKRLGCGSRQGSRAETSRTQGRVYAITP